MANREFIRGSESRTACRLGVDPPPPGAPARRQHLWRPQRPPCALSSRVIHGRKSPSGHDQHPRRRRRLVIRKDRSVSGGPAQQVDTVTAAAGIAALKCYNITRLIRSTAGKPVLAKLSRGSSKARTKARALKWVVLAVLVWPQFASAEHGHNHALDGPSHVCAICQQLDSGEHPLADAAPTHAIPPAAPSLKPASVAVESTVPFPHYSARASPTPSTH